ncbi:MAG: hypothetical protein IT209_06765 [Armatimonadetes bacterium]|nr:hypothetical protein [Armatimonadota bacterium]
MPVRQGWRAAQLATALVRTEAADMVMRNLSKVAQASNGGDNPLVALAELQAGR